MSLDALFSWLSSLSPLTTSAIVLLLASIAHLALRGWVGRRSRDAARDAPPAAVDLRLRHWIAQALRQTLAPLALLIWVHGLYLAVTILLSGTADERVAAIAEWIYRAAVVAALFWLLSRIGRLIDAFLSSLATRSGNTWDDLMLPLAGRAARILLPLLALILAAPALNESPALAQLLRNGASLLLIAVVAFILYQAVDAAAQFVLKQHRIDTRDNLRARAIHTQVLVLKKVAVAVIVVFAAASMLMVFDSVRQFGASILASAGIAGIIVGLAAQKSIATLLAGFQIALTQPIRVDDVVIVEGEWGRIEDITLTYVVVRIWDLRRLVLPITYFIEQPFQNWTRVSSDILGTVFLRADYGVPVDALRAELTRILNDSPLWDRKVNVLQVTDAGERTVEIRALMSAPDASTAWDLRCHVRERLIAFLQREHPECLPRFRAEIQEPASTGSQVHDFPGSQVRGSGT